MRARLEVGGIGEVEVYHLLVKAADGLVTFETHHLFVGSRDTIVSTSTLRFMSKDEMAGYLTQAGFTDIVWCGVWNGVPFAPESREIIAMAE